MAKAQQVVEQDYGHLPGETTEKAKALRAIEAIEDEEVRKTALSMLKAKEESVGKQFGELGVISRDETDALSEIDTLAGAMISKADGKLTMEQARAQLWKDRPDLYKAYLQEMKAS